MIAYKITDVTKALTDKKKWRKDIAHIFLHTHDGPQPYYLGPLSADDNR
jgi:hypothetical protein